MSRAGVKASGGGRHSSRGEDNTEVRRQSRLASESFGVHKKVGRRAVGMRKPYDIKYGCVAKIRGHCKCRLKFS